MKIKCVNRENGDKVFPGGSVRKNLSANALDAGDVGLIPGLGRSPGEGNGLRIHTILALTSERVLIAVALGSL